MLKKYYYYYVGFKHWSTKQWGGKNFINSVAKYYFYVFSVLFKSISMYMYVYYIKLMLTKACI